MSHRIGAFFRSAVTAYVVLGLTVAFVLGRQQQNFTNDKRANGRVDRILCTSAQVSWDTRTAMIVTLTEHNVLPVRADLRELVVTANRLKDERRAHLLQLSGERPSC